MCAIAKLRTPWRIPWIPFHCIQATLTLLLIPILVFFCDILEKYFVILSAVEDADNGNQLSIRSKSYYSPLLVVGDTKTGANIVAFCTA
jgi:hypothetical protein